MKPIATASMICLVLSCGTGPRPASTGTHQQAQAKIVQRIPDSVTVSAGREPSVSHTDLPDITDAGVLRVLIHRGGSSSLDRTGSPLVRELALIELFARSQHLPVRFVNVSDRSQLIPALIAGKGDVVASRMTQTQGRAAQVRFTSPVRYVEELVVAPTTGDYPSFPVNKLAGKDIWMRSTSSFAEHLRALNLQPAPRIQPIEAGIDTHQLLYRVGSGAYRLAVVDSDLLESYRAYRDDVRVVSVLSKRSPIAWAVRPGSQRLLRALDDFIVNNVRVHQGPDLFTGDLDEIKKRGVLRIAMPNNGQSYFFFRGAPLGQQYSQGVRLAKRLGVQLEVVVAHRQRDLIPLLLDGRADLVASTLTITPQRQKLVDFSTSVSTVDELLVVPATGPAITSVDQLSGVEIHVRRASAYWDTLSALKATVPGLVIVAADSQLETEQLVEMVAVGTIPATVADFDIIHAGLSQRTDIRTDLVLANSRHRAYALRKSNTQLKEAVDRFTTGINEGNASSTKASASQPKAPTAPGSWSPYDDIARTWADHFQLDYALVLALMKVESGFDPDYTTWIGARGLMGVMPHTLPELDLDVDLSDADAGTQAGTKRLRQIMDTLPPTLAPSERRKFAIAAYHAGLGHLGDARLLASQQGLNADVWEDNVASALLLKADPDYAEKTRFGYCTAAQTLGYVAEVEAAYQIYANAEPG